MTDLVKRLKATLASDAINGDAFERNIATNQLREAIYWIERQDTQYGDFDRHRCPRCDLVIWADNMQYGDGTPAPCPECCNVRWAMVAEQVGDLDYGLFHLVKFGNDGKGWIVYRKGFSVFNVEGIEPQYFNSASQALDACDALLADEKEKAAK